MTFFVRKALDSAVLPWWFSEGRRLTSAEGVSCPDERRSGIKQFLILC